MGILDDDNNRSALKAAPRLALTNSEIAVLDRLVPDSALAAGILSAYLIKIDRLGGYLARIRDPPPGNILMWRGLSRLSDILICMKIAAPGHVGN